MSTDSEDQGFDETLKNFQLLTGLSPASAATNASSSATTTSTAISNPFQIGLSSPMENETIVKQIFGTHCQCGAERMLTPNNNKQNQSSSSSSSGNNSAGSAKGGSLAIAGGTTKHTSTSLEHGIINPTSFKHKSKVDRKVLVRESMLKNIGKCVHQNLVKQQQQGGSSSKDGKQQYVASGDSTFLPVPAAGSLKPSLSENNLPKCFHNEDSEDILDFRLLVSQCSELTLSPTSGGAGAAGRLSDPTGGPNFSQSSFKSLRQPDFSSFQLSRSSTSRRNRRARHLKRYNSTSSLESDSSSNGGGGTSAATPFGNNSFGGPSSSGGTSSGTTSGTSQNSQQQSPSSASCSTQARLNDLMPCDITIDEMASYFETLVHIPKKMSSMAEMMYI